ncbi:hypothetical protein ABZP36_021688 [Zizania latifolia]
MAEEAGKSGVRVCVTGGAGFIGSWLVKKLLDAGYTVHATLRSIGTYASTSSRLLIWSSGLMDGSARREALLLVEYILSKLLSEKELLGYSAGEDSPAFEVVTVPTETLPSVQAHSDKLGELGFKYKHGMQEILDCSIECAVRVGCLDAAKLNIQE